MLTPLMPVTIPHLPTASVQPFTYKDGMSFYEKLACLARYINREVIPYVNASYEEVAENTEEIVNNLIAAFNEAVTYFLENPIELQDTVMEGIVNDVDSLTRTALEAIFDLRYSPITVANVKHYGAIGDNVADDTAAFVAAIDAADDSFGVVHIPAGIYKISTNLDLPRGVMIVGEGVNNSVISGPTGGALKINVKGGSQGVGGDWGGPSLRDITLHGIGVVFGETTTDWGNGASLENVEIRYTTVGLTLRYNSWVFRGTNLRIHQCETAGILHDFTPVTAGSGANISYINCVVFNCTNSGFAQNGVAADGGHISFVNCDIENSGVSYNLSNVGQTVYELTNGHYELNNVAYIRADSGLIWVSGCWMFELRSSSVTKVALFDLSGTARVMVMSGRISWSASSRLARITSSSTRALVIDTENVILPLVGMDVTIPGDPCTTDSSQGLTIKPGSSRSADTQVNIAAGGALARVLSTHQFDRTTYECEWTVALTGTTTGVNFVVHVRPVTGGASFTIPMQAGATLANVKVKMSLTEAVITVRFDNGQGYVGRSALTHTTASTRYIETALGAGVSGVIVTREIVARGV